MSHEPAEARHDHAVVAQQKFCYMSFDIIHFCKDNIFQRNMQQLPIKIGV